MNLSLPELEVELISLLQGQGLPVEEIRLIGLLGKGTRATVFSVIIDGVYHVLKVYDNKDSLRAELKHLRRMIPRDRFLFWWQERLDGSMLNLAIIEVPEGRELTANRLTDTTCRQIAERLVALHRLHYRQKVSVTSLVDRVDRNAAPYLAQLQAAGLPTAQSEQLLDEVFADLREQADNYRVRKVRVHGDLWWPNIIAAQEDVYLIDWESIRRGDAADDLAKLRISLYFPRDPDMLFYFWSEPADRDRAEMMFRTVTEMHSQMLDDPGLTDRLRLYLAIHCIEALANRHLDGMDESELDRLLNGIIAGEALRLWRNPLDFPPADELAGYFELIGQISSDRQA